MRLYKIDYQCGWHNESMPLLSWCYVLGKDPTDATNKLTAQKNVHEGNVRRIEPQEFIS